MRPIFSMFLALCMLSIVSHASAEEFEVDGITVELPALDGQCYLSPSHEIDAAILKKMQSKQARRNHVVGIAYPCSAIAAVRQGRPSANYGMWLANAPNGKIVRVPNSYSREQVLDELSATMPQDQKEIASSLVRDAAKREGIDLSLGSIRYLGRNDDALFSAIRVKMSIPGSKSIEVTGVYGVTMINSRLFSFNLYQRSDDDSSYEALLTDVKQVMAQAVASNTQDDGVSTLVAAAKGINWWVAAASGLVAGLLTWLIGVVPAMRRRLRGW